MTDDCSAAGGAESFVTQNVNCSVAGGAEGSVAGGAFLVGFAYCYPSLLHALPCSC